MKRIALIGLGKQNTKDHLAAAQKNNQVSITAVCDQNKIVAKEWGTRLGVPHFHSIEKLVASCELDAAVVAVPHFAYEPLIRQLAAKGIHILKEKPFAMNFAETLELRDIVSNAQINLTVAVQRKYNKIYQTYREYAKSIGDIFSIHGHYTLNIERLDEGWRSSAKLAGGGVVLDMGYHLLDLIVWYFGVPERISAELGYHNRRGQTYDVEDTAKIQFSYTSGKRRILGSILLSRIYPEKAEALSIYGTHGTIVIYKDRIELYSLEKELIESVFIKSNGEDVNSQFNAFLASLDEPENSGNYRGHLENMVFIDAIYRSDAEGITIQPFKDEKYRQLIQHKGGLHG